MSIKHGEITSRKNCQFKSRFLTKGIWTRGYVDTAHGIVAVWNHSLEESRQTTGLRFIYAGRSYSKHIYGPVTRRGIIAVARRFAAECVDMSNGVIQ